ncbi:MAG TPA: CHAT domain-containing protein, partial [Ilumatobacteraceae bacterium]|nr:CHAT domain-containing protein [Ilumatobacteraceae bacterium]
TPRADAIYDVRVTDATGRTAEGTFTVPLSADDLERTVLRLAANGTTRRATAAPGPTRDVGGTADRPIVDAELLGGSLATALLSGDVGEAYRRAMERAENHGHGTRMTLSLAGAPALLSVPWEFLYERPRFLASQRRTPIVRLLETGSMGPAPVIDGAVRILGIVASPRDLAPLDVDLERRRITQALAHVQEAGQVRLDWLEPASPKSLRLALRDGNYHVIHYVGHSDFTSEGSGVIYLEDPDDRSSVEVDETLFANLLSDQNVLRLVVLNSCEGARTTMTDPYAGVATTLVQLGVPAVVAMQFEISDRAAIVFAEELYTNLIGRRDPIDASVAEARKAVYSDVDRVEWATPVLFVRDPDVQLFRFGHGPEPRPDTAPDRAVGPVEGSDGPPAPPPPWWRTLLKPFVLGPAVLVLAVAIAFLLQQCGDGGDGSDGTVATTTTIGGSTTNATLGFPTTTVGDDGPVVLALQRLLAVKGLPIEASGFFDDATEDAVRQVEAQTNIPVDGTVGRVTWQQLAAPIRRGDRGEAVLGAEELLALLGADIAPDDQFTNGTQALVVDFQRDNGLAVDGIVDIDTWRVLLALADRLPATATAPTTTATA